MARYETAATIINRAAKELGLWASTVADPYAATNPLAAQLCALLVGCGQDLASMVWPHLIREHTITGDGTTTSFALPSDFLSLVSGAAWDRTNDEPLVTPDARGWQMLKAENLGATIQLHARVLATRTDGHSDCLQFVTAPANGSSIVVEYVSRNWVQLLAYVYGPVEQLTTTSQVEVALTGTPTTDANTTLVFTGPGEGAPFGLCQWVYGEYNEEIELTDEWEAITHVLASATGYVGTSVTLTRPEIDSEIVGTFAITPVPTFGDEPTAAGQTILFDPLLAVRALKLAFKREKGFDTTSAELDYQGALDRCRGQLVAASNLSLVGGGGFKLIDGSNVPGTGIGA